MTKRTTGVILILVSALLLISRYITAAMSAHGAGIVIVGAFEEVLDRTIPLLIASIVTSIVAAAYLVLAEREKET